jgi:hypothetical protein
MPRGKKTTMLVRAVPLDVSERVRRYCRREDIRYREFLERAIDLFEGPNRKQGQDQGHGQEVPEQVTPIERVAKIAENVKAYKNAIRLQKDLVAILRNVEVLTDWEHQRHIYLEVLKMAKELNEIINKYIPKHEIPDDPKAMAAMGLPPELIYKMDLTEEEWQEKRKRDAEADKEWRKNHKPEDFLVPDDVKKIIDEAKRELGIKDLSNSDTLTEDPATSATDQEKAQPESKEASTESSQTAGKHEEKPG